MKKIAIIIAMILTTGVTAFSLTRNDNKPVENKVKIDNSKVTVESANRALSTAD